MGRTKNIGLVYLRRSSKGQEASLEQQLEWALRKAKSLEVRLDASLEILNHILTNRITHYCAVYLDDGVTGADMNRPGLNAFRRAALENRDVSHLFLYRADRLARPDITTEAMQLEEGFLYAGITIVFSNRISPPRRRGENYVAESMQALFEHSESGEFLRKHADRIVASKIRLAKGGYWTGGRAPYGFVRVLVDVEGKEVQELEDGMHVRKSGCHVRIRPKDQAKIDVWLKILKWYCEDKKGVKWIANQLNTMGILSPNAGQIRMTNGVQVRNKGRWGHRTVQALIENPAIIGVMRCGVRAEGEHRRLGEDGPRLLEDADRRADGTAKVTRNPGERIISAQAGYEPLAPVDLYQECQQIAEARGRSQRGISRTSDPSRYPLAMLIFDLTDECGYPLYARTSGKRSLYTCGRYLKTSGGECEHNQVDAEAILEYACSTLSELIIRLGCRDALISEIRKFADAEAGGRSDHQYDSDRLQKVLKELNEEIALIQRNLARATDDEQFKAIGIELKDVQARRAVVQRQFDELQVKRQRQKQCSPAEEVDAAIALLDNFDKVLKDPGARADLPKLFRSLNLKIGLRFVSAKKGKRDVRQLAGGVMALGDGRLPVPPYGKDALEDTDPQRSRENVLAPSDRTDRCKNFVQQDPREGVSFTKVNRGDWTPVELFLRSCVENEEFAKAVCVPIATGP